MMFIKHNVHHPRPSKSGDGGGRSSRRRVSTDSAAVLIQSMWRGAKERKEMSRRKVRTKPHGFYTHTLGLTYTAVRSSRTEKVPRSRLLYLLLEDPSSGPYAQGMSVLLICTIGLSILGFVLETEPSIYDMDPSGWFMLEVLCSIVFTAEFLGRLAVCSQAGLTHREFLMMPLNILDLLSVLPFWIERVLELFGFRDPPALRALRVFRLIRVARVFKLGRYADGMRLTAKALLASSQAISVLVFLLGMGMVLFSGALFHLEKLSCPDREVMSEVDMSIYEEECTEEYNRGVSPKFGLCCTEHDAANDFPSIVATFWWSIVTMTSVGYGDIYPKTVQGKVLGFFVMLVGMIVIALPVAIVGQKFHDVYETHHLEMARFQGAARMKVPGEDWSLVPSSDICQKLRNLQLKDSALAGALIQITSNLDEVWQQRELLMRERRYQLNIQGSIRGKMGQLISTLEEVAETDS